LSVRLHIGDAAVASMATAAARQVPGVVAHRAEVVRTAVDTEGTEVAVTLVTRWGHNCRDLAAAVQQAVTLALAEQAGIAARVQVTIAEVLLD
jgi:uncharacterized alkaline shock family protein YloU